MNSFNIVTLSCLDWSGFMSTVEYKESPFTLSSVVCHHGFLLGHNTKTCLSSYHNDLARGVALISLRMVILGVLCSPLLLEHSCTL